LPIFTKKGVPGGILFMQKYGVIFLFGHSLLLRAKRESPWINIQAYILCPMEAIKILMLVFCTVSCADQWRYSWKITQELTNFGARQR